MRERDWRHVGPKETQGQGSFHLQKLKVVMDAQQREL